jgi:hypothetical protein
MFLHLSHDEKFIDSARHAFEQAAPEKNEFVVVDARGPLRYIRSFEPCRKSMPELLARDFLERLPAYDAIFLHSLNKPNRLIVDKATADARFVWLGWGFDYYGLICTGTELLLPQTRALVDRNAFVGGPARPNAMAMLKEAFSPDIAFRLRAGLRSRQIGPGGADEMTMLRKITFFAPVLTTEDARIRVRHPEFAPRFASWNYGVHDIVENLPNAGPSNKAERIIVGNNAMPECNHADAFEWISRTGLTGDIVCPLSYGGNMRYRNAVIEEGHARFGDRFLPLTEYMAAAQYAELIASSKYLVMNHLRQQGLTNVLIALQTGTRVLMNAGNPLFPFLRSLELKVDALSEPADTEPLGESIVTRHREKVSAYYGAMNHHRRTLELLASVVDAGSKEGTACTG